MPDTQPNHAPKGELKHEPRCESKCEICDSPHVLGLIAGSYLCRFCADESYRILQALYAAETVERNFDTDLAAIDEDEDCRYD